MLKHGIWRFTTSPFLNPIFRHGFMAPFVLNYMLGLRVIDGSQLPSSQICLKFLKTLKNT